MKRILAFGDSNTWGWDPANDGITRRRFSDEERWTGVAQKALGPGYLILNEGLNGRTTVFDDPIEEYRCGKQHLIPLLDTHAPLDLVIIMLGTNDLKIRFGASAAEIAEGARLLAEKTLQRGSAFADGAPRLLLVCPPPLGPVSETWVAGSFAGSEEKSRLLHPHYCVVAQRLGIAYLNAGEVIRSSELDGLHLDLDQHQALGRKIAQVIPEALG